MRVPTPIDVDTAASRCHGRPWEEFRIAVEPAAAAPLAALAAGRVPGELPCLVLCGANTTWRPTG